MGGGVEGRDGREEEKSGWKGTSDGIDVVGVAGFDGAFQGGLYGGEAVEDGCTCHVAAAGDLAGAVGGGGVEGWRGFGGCGGCAEEE